MECNDFKSSPLDHDYAENGKSLNTEESDNAAAKMIKKSQMKRTNLEYEIKALCR
jgi:hypothetical protein